MYVLLVGGRDGGQETVTRARVAVNACTFISLTFAGRFGASELVSY